MKLYFGNSVTTATTLMIIALLGFVAYAALNRDSRHWGIRSLILLVFGLVVCCFAAARDGFDADKPVRVRHGRTDVGRRHLAYGSRIERDHAGSHGLQADSQGWLV